jgi:chromosome segregation ATPase
MEVMVDIISTVGFPIACVIGLGWFIYKIYNDTTKREDKLYEELANCRAVNEKAIDTIAHYAEKLDIIQSDINDIKTDITVIKSK